MRLAILERRRAQRALGRETRTDETPACRNRVQGLQDDELSLELVSVADDAIRSTHAPLLPGEHAKRQPRPLRSTAVRLPSMSMLSDTFAARPRRHRRSV